MATTTQISLDTYLTTSYEPDMDYVDGLLEDRNVGEYGHNIVQRAILIWFYLHEKECASGPSRSRERAWLPPRFEFPT